MPVNEEICGKIEPTQDVPRAKNRDTCVTFGRP